MPDGRSPDHNEQQRSPRTSLRGTMTIVIAMAVFFVLCWLGVLALAMERR